MGREVRRHPSELQDTGAGTSIHMEIVEGEARGYDRSSAGHFTTRVTEQRVQLFDHAEGAWFTFEVEIAP